MVEPLLSTAGRVALPLAVGAAMVTVSSLERDPSVAAEAAVLALLTTALLATTAFLAPRITWQLGFLFLLPPVALLSLPATPDRSAAVGAALLATTALAAVDAFREGGIASPARLVPLVLAVQILAHPGEKVGPAQKQDHKQDERDREKGRKGFCQAQQGAAPARIGQAHDGRKGQCALGNGGKQKKIDQISLPGLLGMLAEKAKDKGSQPDYE